MASPQTQNGYLKIAMEIVEALARHRIPGQEMQLIWVLLRKTWGWSKKADQISLSQFAKLTGIDRSSCSHLINSLLNKNIVKEGVDKKVNSLIRIYRFNKDYETWKSVDKKPTRGNITNKVLSKVSTEGVVKVSTTIDKEKIIDIYSSCPHKKIIELYHDILPELTRIKEWTPLRSKMLKKRWDEDKERQTLDYWKGFFEYVKKSKFLMGDKSSFQADLEWLIRPNNFIKVIEGKYENNG